MFLDGRQPVKYGLRMEIDDKYLSLKKELAKLCGIPETRLLLAEVYSSLIRVSVYSLYATPEWYALVACMLMEVWFYVYLHTYIYTYIHTHNSSRSWHIIR